MRKNLFRYLQAWGLRQQGRKLAEIASIMGFKSKENARRMIAYIDFVIKYRKPLKKEFKQLLNQYRLKK